MTAKIDEIGDGLFRVSVFDSRVAPPHGFTFNHFLLMADEPMLFHTGKRGMFPEVSAGVAKLIALDRIRWIGFGHFEADECGAMNEWLAASPHAELVHGVIGCRVSVADMADRPPRALKDGEVLDIGGKRMRFIDTPHVPHGWDAGVMYEENSAMLLCSDLFSQYGQGPALTQSDIVEPSTAANNFVYSTSLGPTTVPTLRKLAQLNPKKLAVMHGSSFEGDGGAELTALADRYEAYLKSVAVG
jgi:flavorubredoxin